MRQNHNSSQEHIANENDATVNNNIYDDTNSYNKAQTDSQYHPLNFNFTHWKDLDPIYIQSRWIQREDSRVIMMCAALFGTLAWFFLIVVSIKYHVVSNQYSLLLMAILIINITVFFIFSPLFKVPGS
jgi:hypothetical protein